jgi:hypothetical protein
MPHPPGAAGRALKPLTLIAFDATDIGPLAIPRIERSTDGTARGTGGLTRFWRMGAALHRVASRADRTLGARSWREALRWAASVCEETGRPLGELQAWGHGGWGYMGMGGERLDEGALTSKSSPLAGEIDALRASFGEGALLWLRCCSAFGTSAGQRFAQALTDRLGVRAAAHTYIIGAWQSGTHSLAPGDRPSWSDREGVEVRSGGPVAQVSTPFAPSTVTCLHFSLPAGY